ncbi:hypothetical protein NBRC110019_25210 [Neptunitalea chrysea]|uniref:Uncharacterized protein n=1 Tax=Neptunitalea chrysea TaxID=1647581 RepID=A0A9W6EUG7_9FLAO|nr:hypothetical protein [Neptunitalea chrysea]GLB53480.1 hypothetical protein NBRC110019_25210 [Neptunitalea chrysea]
MNLIIILLQQPNIDEKIKSAPDNSYVIGVLIGYLLPITIIAAFAYLMFSYFKKRRKE